MNLLVLPKAPPGLLLPARQLPVAVSVVIRLPASGILVRYPALAGLNPNGSLHIEDKTIPDTEIKGNKPDERLNNLIDRLNDSLLFI